MKATSETHDLEAAVPLAPAAVAAIRMAEAVAASAAAAASAEKLKAENPKAVAEKVEEEKKQVAAAAAAAVSAAEEEHKQKQKAPAANKEEDPRRPRVRWVRKVYGILSLQFVLTAAVFATACLVRPVPLFFVDGPPAAVWPAFTGILVSPLIVMFPMLDCSEKKRRRNLVLLGLYTLCCSFSIALSAPTITVDIAVLQVTILTVLGLTLFTIWGAKTGYEFIYKYACLLTGITMTLLYIIVEVPFPLKMVGIAICLFLITLVLSAFVVVVYICDIDDKNLSDNYNGGGSSNEEDDSGSFGAQRV